MTLQLNDEQISLGRSVRHFVESRAPLSVSRELAEGGRPYDEETWHRLSAAFGLTGLTTATELGGADGTYTDLSVALFELGRHLVPSPVMASVLSAEVLRDVREEDVRSSLLTKVCTGEAVIAPAVSECAHGRESWLPAMPSVTADGDDDRLTGEKTLVLNGAQADLLLVLAGSPAGPAFFLVDGSARGVERVPLSSMDLTRSLARVRFREAPARRLTCDTPRLLDRLTMIADVLVASEQLGAAERCIEMTVEYARDRVAFGRTIGSFQAVKHELAQRHLDWEIAYSTLRAATRYVDDESASAAATVSAARWLASTVYTAAARSAVQLHGGLGYTWEHDAHLFYRSAFAQQSLMSPAGGHLARLADLVAS